MKLKMQWYKCILVFKERKIKIFAKLITIAVHDDNESLESIECINM